MEWRGRPAVLWLLMGLLGYLGIRALLGGGQFIVAPSGAIVGLSPAVLSGTPFRDFLLPGLFLFVGLGVFPLVVLYGVYRGYRWAPAGGFLAGGATHTSVFYGPTTEDRHRRESDWRVPPVTPPAPRAPASGDGDRNV